MTTNIILSTLNARYIHSSLGLRYLLANMGELRSQTQIIEYVIHTRPADIVESLLQQNPRIIGFSMYIWNVEPLTQVVSLIKQVRPEIIIILGGPEISYETDAQAITLHVDYIICGAADLAFAELCRQLLPQQSAIKHSQLAHKPPAKILNPSPITLDQLQLPYAYYTDEDIAHRVIYVEASRGCPYKCEFCLSALDKTVAPFHLDRFLIAMQQLYDRGARRFKFVDRTFNLKVDTSISILKFFLERMTEDLFLHFELIPDHLPDKLKTVIASFPPGTLQFEIGIQSFNPRVQTTIRRKQNNRKSKENLHWLREHSHAHLHTDLIIGLPGEDVKSFAAGFDQLVQLNPHEIQVGILKRLRGSPIIRHTEPYTMCFNPYPPYNILQTSKIDFNTMQRLSRFARYWDMLANSGRFKQTLLLILQDQPFNNFMELSDWLYNKTGQSHGIALDRLFELMHEGINKLFNIREEALQHALYDDFILTGLKNRPSFAPVSETVTRHNSSHLRKDTTRKPSTSKQSAPKRQVQHLNQTR